MKSLNHRICGIAFAMLANASYAELVYTFLASSVPDQIEKIGTKKILSHRGISHDLGIWGILMVVFCASSLVPEYLIPPKLFSGFTAFRSWMLIFPIFIHLLMDALTPRGVPLFVRFRLCLPVFGINRWYEYFFSWGMLCMALIIYVPETMKSFLSFAKEILKLRS